MMRRHLDAQPVGRLVIAEFLRQLGWMRRHTHRPRRVETTDHETVDRPDGIGHRHVHHADFFARGTEFIPERRATDVARVYETMSLILTRFSRSETVDAVLAGVSSREKGSPCRRCDRG